MRASAGESDSLNSSRHIPMNSCMSRSSKSMEPTVPEGTDSRKEENVAVWIQKVGGSNNPTDSAVPVTCGRCVIRIRTQFHLQLVLRLSSFIVICHCKPVKVSNQAIGPGLFQSLKQAEGERDVLS